MSISALSMSRARPAAARGSHRTLLGCVVGLLLLHPIATFLFLPALPLLQAHFDATPQAVQWTLSAAVLGFGLTQLVWGALADRWGRRTVAWLGVGCFLFSTGATMFAPSIEILVALRLLQGTGVAAAGVAARAALRDHHPQEACARQLALAFAWLSVAGLIGPPAAAALAQHGGLPAMWSGAMLAGLAVIFTVHRYLPTGATLRRPAVTGPSGRIPARTLRRIASHPVFRAYTALTAFSYCGHYVFLVGSSALLIDHHGVSLIDYGLILSAGSLVHLAGAAVCHRWIAVHGVPRTVAHASVVGLSGATTMALLAVFDVQAPWAVVGPYALYLFAHAVHQSCGQAAVMAPFGKAAGTAAALNGTVLPVTAVVSATVLAEPLHESTQALPFAVAACAALTAWVAWTAVRRHGALHGTEDAPRPLNETATP